MRGLADHPRLVMKRPTSLVETLWRQVFGEPPSLAAPMDLLCKILVENLPLAPPYEVAGSVRRSPEPADDDTRIDGEGRGQAQSNMSCAALSAAGTPMSMNAPSKARPRKRPSAQSSGRSSLSKE